MYVKATLVQQDILWANPAGNCAHVDELLRGHEGSDIYILPEMFSTGFATEPEGIAEEYPSASLDWMKRRAAEFDAAIVGSIAIHKDGKYYNRCYFVKPDGSVAYYDKHHLFSHSNEHLRFTAGNSRTVVEWRGIRFLLITCFDLRFPVWCRCKDDYDAIICVANWPAQRQDNFDLLTCARAIENQSYVLATNRVGTDGAGLEYTGGTVVAHPYGYPLMRCEYGVEEVMDVKFDMHPVQSFRERFPVLADADPFELKLNSSPTI